MRFFRSVLPCLLFAPAILAQSPLSPDDVITLRDGKLHLDGKPFAEISFNKFDLLWQLHEQAAAGKPLDDTNPLVLAQDRALADLSSLGFRTIRVFALPWGPAGPAAWADPAKRPHLHAALDKMADLCERHRIGIVWSLGLGTFTDTKLVPGKGWVHGEEHVRELIANPDSRGRKLACEYLTDIVARYRHRKAVAMWEITNEATLHADIGDQQRVYQNERMPTLAEVAAFLDDTAKRIKAIDPLRLVNSGGSSMREHQWHLHLREGWKLDSPEEQFQCFQLLYGRSAIDLVDIHYYPNHTPGHRLRGDNGQTVILDAAGHMAIAKRLGKPLMIGELGALPAAKAAEKTWTEAPDYFESFADHQAAARWMSKVLDQVVEARVPLSYWWCYQSDRAMDQNNPQRMDISLSRNPQLVRLVADANRRLQAKLAANPSAAPDHSR